MKSISFSAKDIIESRYTVEEISCTFSERVGPGMIVIDGDFRSSRQFGQAFGQGQQHGLGHPVLRHLPYLKPFYVSIPYPFGKTPLLSFLCSGQGFILPCLDGSVTSLMRQRSCPTRLEWSRSFPGMGSRLWQLPAKLKHP